MLLCVTVRELSVVLSFCQFCDFLIYISVRFVYISVTLLFTLFFLYLLTEIYTLPSSLVICVMSGKSLILNRFFLS